MFVKWAGPFEDYKHTLLLDRKNETMELILHNDWDSPVTIPQKGVDRTWHFAGRERELDLLSNELKRRKSGSILVTGYPGVEKTSLVYESLHHVIEANTHCCIVLINATQLASKTEVNDPLPYALLRTLVRRLYSNLVIGHDEQSASIKKKIETLYKKAVAKEFQLRETHEIAAEVERSEEESVEDISQITSVRL